MKSLLIGASSILISASLAAQAEVMAAAPDHFTLKLEAQSELSPSEVWTRLIEPSDWWQSDHTYSGDADHLSLDP